jgi:hypothetical protein
LEYGVFALFDKKPNDENNVDRNELLHFPSGSKGHKVFGHPKANPWKFPNTTSPLWKDQWGYGIAKWLIKIFTLPGEYVGDFFCGTGTGSVCAIKMGRNAVAVDKLAEAITHTTTRLDELKAEVEHTEYKAWATVQNAMSMISLVPDWSRCDWTAIAKREKRVQDKIKKKCEDARKKQKKGKVDEKKKETKKKADELAAKKLAEAKAAEAAAKELVLESDEEEEEDDEENDEEKDEEMKDDVEPINIGLVPPVVDIGLVTPVKEPAAVDVDDADDVTADETPGASPSVTRSKAADDGTK